MTLRACLFAFILLTMAAAIPCRGQVYDPSRMSRKARALYEQSLGKASDGNYRGALETVGQAIALEPGFVEAWLTRAGLQGELRDYPSAAAAYEKAFALDSLFAREYRLPYAINLGGMGRFSEAIPALERFLQLPGLDDRARRAASYRLECFRLGDSLSRRTTASGYVFDARNLGDSVNSPYPEYYPSLTVDGRTLVFTRRDLGTDENFLVARRDSSGWRLAARLEGDINTALNEGAQNISQDGEWLVFTGCNFPDGMGSCDLYVSFRNRQGGWSRPRNLGEPVNTEAWESAPCLSPDRRALYFASSRPGGMGGNDIWVSRRQPNGSWGEPENLGAPVNTAGNESCPFLHADGRTLYFTSDTHPGIGGDDLFVTHMRPDGGWDSIRNLGYPINTIGNEGSLVVAADGLSAYFASERGDSRGSLDLYTFRMRPDIAPRPTTWVQGRVFDARTGQGLPSAVELTDLVDGRLISRVQTDEDGRYLVTLPTGTDYGFHVRRRGYLFHSGSFPLSQSPTASYTLDIPLKPIERDAVLELRNLYFASGSASLAPASTAELDLLVQLLTENPTLRIKIEGHTDDVGSAQDNLALSNRRAAAVVEHLVSKGIPRTRLSSQGFGATRPVMPNTSEEARARNRRTELRVVGL